MNDWSAFAEVWQRDWATDVETEVVLIVPRTWYVLRVTAKSVRVEFLVPDEIIDLAVIIIPTTLLREVNNATR